MGRVTSGQGSQHRPEHQGLIGAGSREIGLWLECTEFQAVMKSPSWGTPRCTLERQVSLQLMLKNGPLSGRSFCLQTLTLLSPLGQVQLAYYISSHSFRYVFDL